jgi:hypothetical protein
MHASVRREDIDHAGLEKCSGSQHKSPIGCTLDGFGLSSSSLADTSEFAGLC